MWVRVSKQQRQSCFYAQVWNSVFLPWPAPWLNTLARGPRGDIYLFFFSVTLLNMR